MNKPNHTPNPFAVVPQLPCLDDLARALREAKEVAAIVQQKVYDSEKAIVAAVGAETEGSFTVRCDHYKITTTQAIARSVDKDALEAVRREFPEDLFEAMFDYRPSLNVKLFKECEHLRPEVYALACKAVTSKPGKVAVKVEVLS